MKSERLESQTRVVSLWVPDLASHLGMVGVIVAVSVIRWRLIQAIYPTGMDAGNWLAVGHAIFGEHIRSAGIRYPPVIPVLAVMGEWLFGPYAGLQVLAFVSAAAPAIGAYVLFYAWGLRWRAIARAGLLAASAGTGEAMAWGGYPQLIGLGILPLFVLTVDRLVTSRSFRAAIAPAFLAVAALATSDLVGPITVLVGLIYMVVRYAALLRKHQGNTIRNVLGGTILSIVLALPLLTIYLGLIAGVAENERLKLAAGPSVSNALSFINAVANDFPNFWLLGLFVAALVPLGIATSAFPSS